MNLRWIEDELNSKYEWMNAYTINFVDSAAQNNLKLDTKGVGEKRLYLGAKSCTDKVREFFENDKIDYFFIRKEDLLEYLKNSKDEFMNPTQKYKNNISEFFPKIQENIESITEDQLKIKFILDGPDTQNRIFLKCEGGRNKNNKNYTNWNRCSNVFLPRKTKIRFVKFQNPHNKKFIYYINPYFCDDNHHIINNDFIYVPKEYDFVSIKNILPGELRQIRQRDANLQREFRDNLFKKYDKCVVTNVSQKNLLIACHVKPYFKIQKEMINSKSFEEKKQLSEDLFSIKNGFLMTPTIHHIYDAGLITFDDNGKLKMSIFLEKETRQILNLTEDMQCHLTNVDPKYLHYHREKIFSKPPFDNKLYDFD